MAWFDASAVDPATGSQQLPIGMHPVVIKKSSKQPTQDGQSGMLVFDLEIIDGPHKGATGQYRLNMWNKSAQAAEIAAKQLSAICHVVGVFQLNGQPEGMELFGRPFIIVVDKQTGENGDKGYTQIVAVKDCSGNAPVKGQAGQGVTGADQPKANPNAPPWGEATPAVQPAAALAGAPAQPWGTAAPAGAPAATPAAQAPAALPSWSPAPQAAQPPWNR